MTKFCKAVTAGIVTAIALVMLATVAPTAQADSDFEWKPDKGYHTWCYESGFDYTGAADAAMTILRTYTIVDTAYYATCQPKTDVRWSHTSISGIYGRVSCKRWVTSGVKCDSAYALLNKSVINASINPSAQKKKTACHELGHTVGVSHYGGSTGLPNPDGSTHSCLRSGEADGEAWNRRYGDHHVKKHINPYFD